MKIVHNNPKFIIARRELRKNSTYEEEILWQELRGNKLGVKFRRQHSIGGYILDFYCSSRRLIIELDGGYHLQKNQFEYDIVRDKSLKSLDYTVLRFKNEQISDNLKDVLGKIKKEINNPSPKSRRGEGVRSK